MRVLSAAVFGLVREQKERAGPRFACKKPRPFSAPMPPWSKGAIGGESDDGHEHRRVEHAHHFSPSGAGSVNGDRQNAAETPDPFGLDVEGRFAGNKKPTPNVGHSAWDRRSQAKMAHIL
jgi:hypothetical protein